MNVRNYRLYQVGCALLCAFMLSLITACQREDAYYQEPPIGPEAAAAAEPTLLSVTSSGQGQEVRLNLDLSFHGDTDEFRAKQYADDESSGAYQKMNVVGQERVYCILRRKGDPSATTYINIVWEGRQERRVRFDDVRIHLPEGVKLSDSDEWYFMAFMGGDNFDMTTGRISITPGSNVGGAAPQFDDAAMGKIPYWVNWTKLDRVDGSFILPVRTQFKPLGTLLRLQFMSDMIDDYVGAALRLRSNAVQLFGVFDLMSTPDDRLDTPESFPSFSSSSEPETEQLYLLHDVGAHPTAQKLELPGGASWTNGRTLYVWGMPLSQPDSVKLYTTVELQVKPQCTQTSTQTPAAWRTTYHNQGHRAFRHGSTYRLSNILSSDLIISEVFYDYAEAAPNATDNTAQRQNYSIVEVYNPTLSSINLTNYALARLRYDHRRGRYGFHRANAALPHPAPFRGLLLQLSLINKNGGSGTFGGRVGKRDGDRHRSIFNREHNNILKPGQTILIGAGGYIQTQLAPGKNIEEYRQAIAQGHLSENDFAHPEGSPGYQALQAKLRSIEKPYYPHAGSQPDSAFRMGLTQAMSAIDNGADLGAAPTAQSSGTMQLGVGQGMALVKYMGDYTPDGKPSADSDIFVLIDATAPVYSSSDVYRADLLTKLKAKGAKLSVLDEASSQSYSYVRSRQDNFPHADFEERLGEWSVSLSENDGGKSLGSRNYVAGLSPFAPNYSGYTASNNRGARLFWAQALNGGAMPQLPNRDWVAASVRGGANAFAVRDNDAIKIVSGQGVAQPGEEIEKAFDGDPFTIYHSPHYRNSIPATLTFNFQSVEEVGAMIYSPRRDTGINGRFLLADIDYSTDGIGYQRLISGVQFVNTADPQKVLFPANTRAKSIRVVVRQAVGGHFASAGEIEFRRDTPTVSYDLMTLFTDESCGVLRPGVTMEQINACPIPLYKDIARRLYTNKYDEFRVAEYSAYLNPWVIANATKTWPYSIRDNPAGISVQAGETLIVRSAENYKNLRIVVQNLDKPNRDGFGGREYHLVKGENRFEIKEKGLVYVLYQAGSIQELAAAQPIRIHFITGRVNGYYDSQKHQGRWKELLDKAIDPYFDVLGEHAHLTYPTYRLRAKTRDGQALIETYDEIVKAEKEFLGMYRYEDAARGIYRLPRNRMYLHAMYHEYMYAIDYRTAYNDNAGALSLEAESLKNGVWGVAHEIGHINQTRPGLAWQGMDEVTVNLKSLYVQTTVFDRPSRWQVEKDGRGLNRWSKAWNTIIRRKEPHGLREDGSPKLTPFWQLELYFGKVLGQTPRTQSDRGGFYPDLYEYVRTTPNLRTPSGQSNAAWEQSEFVFRASKVSGYDLTDFLENWGFLWEGADVEMRYDYGRKFQYTLPRERIIEVKSRVKALGLKKLPVALEFITDVNYPIYRRMQQIVSGTVTQSGRSYTLTGWNNVVALEFVDGAGAVKQYVQVPSTTNKAEENNPLSFTVQFTDYDDMSWESSYRLRAISCTGERVDVAP